MTYKGRTNVTVADVRDEIKNLIKDLEAFSFEQSELFCQVMRASMGQASDRIKDLIVVYEERRDDFSEKVRNRYELLIKLLIKDEAWSWLHGYIETMAGRLEESEEVKSY